MGVPVRKSGEKIDIESEIPKAIIPDTIKAKKGDEKKPDEKKTAPPAIKPADDKGKKGEKPKTTNDYQ